MATGTIKRELHIKRTGYVNMPFTPTSDGFLVINLTSSTSSGGYVILNDGNSSVFTTYGGSGTSATYPCQKGVQIKQNSISGVTADYQFFALS